MELNYIAIILLSKLNCVPNFFGNFHVYIISRKIT